MANYKTIENGASINLSVEIGRDCNGFYMYISDNMGGSGIDVSGNTVDEVIKNGKEYLKDYFFQRDEDGDFIEE